MDEIYIKTTDLSTWMKVKYFKNKDLVSVEELIGLIEDIDDDLEALQEKYDDVEQDLHDNYKPISHAEMYGISDCDFI